MSQNFIIKEKEYILDRGFVKAAEMMQATNQFIFTTDISTAERKDCRLYRKQVPKLKEKHNRSHCLGNCLRFCVKKRRDMEQRGATPDPQLDPAAEGGMRELVTTWFIQSQAPLISHNGLFPNWFLGFISRKDAEDILTNKAVGCFLVRLSDKALGYILSYRGTDRCRHFVINPIESGQFVVYGDNVRHATVSELIQYFKEKPIEPFGEYLTTSCNGIQNEDLYDTIQVSPKGRSVATVHTQKDKKQMSCQGSERLQTQNREKSRTSEEIPPLPRRSRHLEIGTTTEKQDNVCYAQVRRKKAKDKGVKGETPSRPQSLYAEVDLLDTRCRSLPLLLSSNEEQNYRLSVTPPRHGKDTPSPEPSHRLASQPSPDDGTTAEDRAVYAEVPAMHRPLVDNTYEQLPNSSPYEPVGHMRPKHGASNWGIKNDKWKRLFPEVKRKW